jgi:NAD-dependent deacetylase
MELHGSFADMHCHDCGQLYMRENYLAGMSTCDCGGTIRPGIVLFGEMLPEKAFREAEEAAAKADLFIILGSSLTVSPANMFPLIAKENGAKLVIVNREPTEYDRFADVVIQNQGIKDVLIQLKRQLIK